MSFGVHSSVLQDHENLVPVLQSSKRRLQALMGIRKHSLFRTRLEKLAVASPRSVTILFISDRLC